MGRSGTTLLQSILDAHPEVVAPPESYFMLHLYTKYRRQKKWNDQVITSFIGDLYTDRQFRLFWKVDREEVEASFRAVAPIRSYAQACNAVRLCFNKAYENGNLSLIGDKKPVHTDFPHLIFKLYPDAKVVHMIRDPRGTANGQIKTFKRKDAIAIGLRWSDVNRNVGKLKAQYPNQYHLLKYESLIENPEETVRTLCDFLEIPFSDSMLQYREQVIQRYDEQSALIREKHSSLLKPIDPAIAEKWKTSLTKEQIKCVEYASFNVANEFGYRFERPKPTILMRLKAPISRLKLTVGFSIIKLFFALPFWVRRFVFNMRSRNTDHKYQK